MTEAAAASAVAVVVESRQDAPAYEFGAEACLTADRYLAVAAGRQGRIAVAVVAQASPGSTRHHWVCSSLRNKGQMTDTASWVRGRRSKGKITSLRRAPDFNAVHRSVM